MLIPPVFQLNSVTVVSLEDSPVDGQLCFMYLLDINEFYICEMDIVMQELDYFEGLIIC